MKLEDLFEKHDKETKAKKHPVNVFAKGSPGTIARWLKKEHGDVEGAIAALDAYVDLAGKKLDSDHRATFAHAKKLLQAEVEAVKESVDESRYSFTCDSSERNADVHDFATAICAALEKAGFEDCDCDTDEPDSYGDDDYDDNVPGAGQITAKFVVTGPLKLTKQALETVLDKIDGDKCGFGNGFDNLKKIS